MGSCFIKIAGLKLAIADLKSAAVASLLLLSMSLPARAGDVGNFLGGIVGGIIGQTMQQQRPQPTYPAPQYYQPQYQQPDPAAAEARRQYLARQAELKRQKIQQEKDEAAARAQQAAAAAATTSGTLDVPMKRKDGNLWVPAQINKVVTIDFVIDSGASDITLPRDVYLTLIRSGTLTKANYIGNVQFGIADGSEVKGIKFKLASLQVGNQVLTDVVASVMPSDSATPLLGLSFLSRFQSWAVDNNSGTLKLTPLGGDPTAPAPTQVAAAAPQPLPDLTTVAPPPAPANASPAQGPAPATQTPPPVVQLAAPAAQAPAPPPAAVVQGVPPEMQVANAGLDAPRTGRAPSSALIVKDTTTPVTVAEAAPPSTAPAPKPDTAAAIPVFPANTPYANARSGLLALGYGPAALSDAGKCDSNTDSTCFPERQACARADSVQCEFFWRRGEQVIKVKTVAVPPVVASVECQVNCK